MIKRAKNGAKLTCLLVLLTLLNGCGTATIKTEIVKVTPPSVLLTEEPLPEIDTIKTNGDLLEKMVDCFSALEKANLKIRKIKEFCSVKPAPEK